MAPTAVAVPDTPSRELIEQRTDSSVRIIMPDLPPGEEDASAWGWSWPSGPDSVPIAVTIDGVPADSSTLGDTCARAACGDPDNPRQGVRVLEACFKDSDPLSALECTRQNPLFPSSRNESSRGFTIVL